MYYGPLPEGKTGVSITINDAQEVRDIRNERFPGWWTYGAENLPDHSQYWLSIRNRLYPAWWTYTRSRDFGNIKSV